MKGFNVFLAVLIFLLAVVSAVFSFFLFEKRGQLVDGWADMASRINQTASTLDSGSGTAVANKLSTIALSQTNYAQMPVLLPELPALAEKVVAERNALADGLSQIGSTLEKRDLAADKFQNLGSYASALQQLQGYVSAYQNRNNAILAKVSASAGKLGAAVSVAQLKSGSYSAAYDALDQRISYYLTRSGAFDREVRKMASAMGVQAPDLSESGYDAGLQKVVADVQAVKRDRDKFSMDLQNANRKIANLERTITAKNEEIAALNTTVSKRDQELIRICRVLGMDAPRDPIADGSAEALKLVCDQQKGSVLDMDSKFGFIVISLGEKTQVTEPFGDRVNNINLLLKAGDELTISRNMPSGKAEYINTAKITKVGDNYSVCELLDQKSGKAPKVGDMVYFSDDQIANIVKNRK